MNRKDLVRQVAADTGLSTAAAKAAVETVLAEVTGAIARDEAVRLLRVGTLSVKLRPPRTVRIPSTGAFVTRPASRAVQLDGHHVAPNVTLDGEAYSLSPSFIGAYPQAFAVAGAELLPPEVETDLARDSAGSLTREQRAVAVIGEVRGALRVGPGRDGVVPEPAGMPGSRIVLSAEDAVAGLAPRLTPLPSVGGFEAGFDALRCESGNDNAPDHGVVFTGAVRW